MTRLGRVLARKIDDAAAPPFRIGTVMAATTPRLQIAMESGGALMLPKLSSYSPTVGDSVLVVDTGNGLVVTGAVNPGAAGGGGGPAGPAGRSVSAATVNGSGRLILTMSDGATIDAGAVVGPKGDTGSTGSTGATGPAGTGGVKAWARRTTNTPVASGAGVANAIKITELSATLTAGRFYEIGTPNAGVYSDQASSLRLALHYTTDGSTPSTSSPILQWANVEGVPVGRVETCPCIGYYGAAANVTIRVLLVVYATVSPGGNWGAFGNPSWPLDLLITDVGATVAAGGTQF